MNDALAIDVRGMTKRFGSLVAVDHIDLQVRQGEIHGFLGPNGSGKTTFIRMLCGLLKPDDGHGICLNHNVITQSEAIKRQVGYMTQRFSFWEDLSIRENLDFIGRMYGIAHRRQAVHDAMRRLGLENRQHQLAGSLSGGWKQRLALAACMIHRPRLLLLDEPTAGVDPVARREFWDEIHALAEEGLTFLITTHYMDEAERCHRLAFIAAGKMLTRGSLDEVIAGSRLVTWAVNGPDLQKLIAPLQQQPGVQQATVFGNSLHVSGINPSEVYRAITPYQHKPYFWRQVEPSLEDVFVHLMTRKAVPQ